MNTCIRLREAFDVAAGKHQMLIDHSVAKDVRSKRTNLTMTLIDSKKAYDALPHLFILECLRLYKIDPRLLTFIRQSMSQTQRVSQTSP